jgi:DNA-nicking Smr family endonuclease
MISNFSIDSVGNISTISAVGKEALLKRAQLYRDQARDQESEREKALRRQREAKRRKKLGEAFLEGMTARKAGKSALGLHGKAERRYWLAHNDNTATTSSRLPTVDVHGLLKAEAIRKTEDALCDAILTSQRQLRVIVGKGNHSKGGLPVLKPAIKSEMESQGLVVSVDPTNDGVLVLTWPT